jgi:hypothetical protein
MERETGKAGVASAKPIFIHAMWRTGSTYVWKKFRDQPRYRAYYEPLHHMLVKPREVLRTDQPKSTAAGLRHPAIDDYYFAEFRFTEKGGVEFFEKPLSYERYCLADGEEDEPLRRYLGNLIAYAGGQGQTAVLQFNRSLLRAGWLARNFSPVNILLVRRPANVWKSMLSFENHSFVGVFCIVLGQNRMRAPLNQLPAWVDAPCYRHATIEEDYNAYASWRAENELRLYPSYFDFYVAPTLHCAQSADCILDMDEISSNPVARQTAIARLKELGIAFDFNGYVMPSYALDSDAEREWLAYEPFSRQLLRNTLPNNFTLSRETFERHGPMLGRYFRELLGKFTERPAARLSVSSTSSTVPKSIAPTSRTARTAESHKAGLALFQQRRHEAAAEKFGEALAEQPSGERWNAWATAEHGCSRPMLAELGFRQALRMNPGHGDANANLAKSPGVYCVSDGIFGCRKVDDSQWTRRGTERRIGAGGDAA